MLFGVLPDCNNYLFSRFFISLVHYLVPVLLFRFVPLFISVRTFLFKVVQRLLLFEVTQSTSFS